MTISPDFRLDGFERYEHTDGTFFIRHLRASLPDILAVDRMSANRYHYTARFKAHIAHGTAGSLKELSRLCKEFFGS